MDFQQVEQSYQQLKKLYAAGSLSAEAFDVQLKEMMVQDDGGRWWAKSRESGAWHYHDGQDWIEAVPPARAEVDAPDPTPAEAIDRASSDASPDGPPSRDDGPEDGLSGGGVAATDAARDDYRRDVALTWIDRRLTRDDVDRLRARARELGLGSSETAAIERELLGDLKEVVLLRQVGAGAERSKETPGPKTEKLTTPPDPLANGNSTWELSSKQTTALVKTAETDDRAFDRASSFDPPDPKPAEKVESGDETNRSSKTGVDEAKPKPKLDLLPKVVPGGDAAFDFATIGSRSLAFLIDCAIFVGVFVALELLGLVLDAVVMPTIVSIIETIGLLSPVGVIVGIVVVGIAFKDQLDDIVAFVIGIVVLVILQAIGEAIFGSRDAFDVVLTGLIVCGYFIYFGAKTGQTYGMKSQRIKVARLDGRPLTLENGVMRCLGGLMCVLTAGVGFFVAGSDPKRQGWHDRAAGTTVVKGGP